MANQLIEDDVDRMRIDQGRSIIANFIAGAAYSSGDESAHAQMMEALDGLGFGDNDDDYLFDPNARPDEEALAKVAEHDMKFEKVKAE